MNRKGFIDEINPIYIALCLFGGAFAWFSSRGLESTTFRVIIVIISMIIGYVYLVMTE